MRSCYTTLNWPQTVARALLVTFATGFLSVSLRGQAAPSIPDATTVTRDSSKVVFQTNTSRALYRTARAISNEYGWTVDYEETAIAPSDIEDIALPEWKAAHASEVGILVPRLESIVLAVPNDRPLREGSDKVPVIQSLIDVSLVNRKDRARTVQLEPDGRATMIDAQPAEQKPIGSYELSEQAGAARATLTVPDIVADCSAASGRKLAIGTAPVDLLAQLTLARPEGRVTCRSALSQILDTAPYKLAYSILFDPGNGHFILNIAPVMSTSISPSGEVKSVLVRNPLP